VTWRWSPRSLTTRPATDLRSARGPGQNPRYRCASGVQWPSPPRLPSGVCLAAVSTEAGTDVRQDADVRPDLSFGDGDHERFAHYVDKDKIVDSAVTGTPVVALCGKVWVPSRDPKKFPVCPDCQRIYESLPEGED
jgi:hypothetical protein